mmetsp:Transcript_71734/g.149903  ORF Transcript_71734/g.149903 Transcript_71734/m.149903 type:complete len:106 (-) Transcript_71734:4-321(-)
MLVVQLETSDIRHHRLEGTPPYFVVSSFLLLHCRCFNAWGESSELSQQSENIHTADLDRARAVCQLVLRFVADFCSMARSLNGLAYSRWRFSCSSMAAPQWMKGV